MKSNQPQKAQSLIEYSIVIMLVIAGKGTRAFKNKK